MKGDLTLSKIIKIEIEYKYGKTITEMTKISERCKSNISKQKFIIKNN